MIRVKSICVCKFSLYECWLLWRKVLYPLRITSVVLLYIFVQISRCMVRDAHQWIELLLSCNLSGITCCCVLVEVSWPSVTVIGIYEFTSDLPAQWLTDEREGRRGTQVEVVLVSCLKHRSSFESRDAANIQNLREYPYFTLSFPTISPTPAQMFRIFHAVVCGMNKVWFAKHSSGSTYKGEFVHVGSG